MTTKHERKPRRRREDNGEVHANYSTSRRARKFSRSPSVEDLTDQLHSTTSLDSLEDYRVISGTAARRADRPRNARDSFVRQRSNITDLVFDCLNALLPFAADNCLYSCFKALCSVLRGLRYVTADLVAAICPDDGSSFQSMFNYDPSLENIAVGAFDIDRYNEAYSRQTGIVAEVRGRGGGYSADSQLHRGHFNAITGEYYDNLHLHRIRAQYIKYQAVKELKQRSTSAPVQNQTNQSAILRGGGSANPVSSSDVPSRNTRKRLRLNKITGELTLTSRASSGEKLHINDKNSIIEQRRLHKTQSHQGQRTVHINSITREPVIYPIDQDIIRLRAKYESINKITGEKRFIKPIKKSLPDTGKDCTGHEDVDNQIAGMKKRSKKDATHDELVYKNKNLADFNTKNMISLNQDAIVMVSLKKEEGKGDSPELNSRSVDSNKSSTDSSEGGNEADDSAFTDSGKEVKKGFFSNLRQKKFGKRVKNSITNLRSVSMDSTEDNISLRKMEVSQENDAVLKKERSKKSLSKETDAVIKKERSKQSPSKEKGTMLKREKSKKTLSKEKDAVLQKERSNASPVTDSQKVKTEPKQKTSKTQKANKIGTVGIEDRKAVQRKDGANPGAPQDQFQLMMKDLASLMRHRSEGKLDDESVKQQVDKFYKDYEKYILKKTVVPPLHVPTEQHETQTEPIVEKSPRPPSKELKEQQGTQTEPLNIATTAHCNLPHITKPVPNRVHFDVPKVDKRPGALSKLRKSDEKDKYSNAELACSSIVCVLVSLTLIMIFNLFRSGNGPSMVANTPNPKEAFFTNYKHYIQAYPYLVV